MMQCDCVIQSPLPQVLLNEHNAPIHAIATHPSEPRLLVGSYSCRLKLWDYEQRYKNSHGASVLWYIHATIQQTKYPPSLGL